MPAKTVATVTNEKRENEKRKKKREPFVCQVYAYKYCWDKIEI